MSATEGERSSNSSSVWTLPCHFHTLSLMNCKSKAEAFARSLHSKLKSLGRLSGDGQFYDDDDEDEDYLHPSTDASASSIAGDICFSPSSSAVAAPLNGCESTQQPCSSSSAATKRRPPHDERTYLMSYVPQRLHHGSPEQTATPTYLSPQHGEDELHFDFGISSPESPVGHDDDYGDGEVNFGPCRHHHGGCGLPKANGPVTSNGAVHGPDECCRPTAEEESGCISSVSSVITEQDNDDDDKDEDDEFGRFSPDYWQDTDVPCPWAPQLAVITAQPTPCSLAVPYGMPNALEGSGGCPSPVTKLGTIVEQVTLEESEILLQDQPAVGHDLERGHDKLSDTKNEAEPATSEAALGEERVDGEVEGHEPGFMSGSFECCSDDAIENPMSASDAVQGSELEAGLAARCADAEGAKDGDRDTSVSSDGIGDGLERKDEESGSGERDETSTGFCRVCVSPPPAFLNVRGEGSELLQDGELDTGDGGRAEKTCRLTVDVHQSLPCFGEEGSGATSPTTNDEDFPQRVRRSSSLKTGKTPPGTPNRKKIVRFADAMGLDLEAVKTVFLDDLPVVPSSAYVDLKDGAYLGDDGEDAGSFGSLTIYNSNISRVHLPPFGVAKPRCCLIPVFPQPGSLPDFIDRVRKQSVCLESAVVTGDCNICLVVRVLNLNFQKYVAVRYTYDNWATVHSQVAEYVTDSNDAFSDKFSTVVVGGQLQIGDRLLFAVQYITDGKEFWDNNHGQNYCFQCFVEQQYQPSPPDDSWIHFL